MFADLIHAGIDCFEGFLVNCLEVCCQSETQQSSHGQADSGVINPRLPEATASQQTSAAPPRRVRLQVAQAAERPALVPKLKRKHDSGFSAPRVITVQAPAEHAGVLQSHAAPCMQQPQQLQQHEQQPSPALQPPQHQHVQQCTSTEAADAKRKRRRSGLHRNFMHLTDLHASWLSNACMHGVSPRS